LNFEVECVTFMSNLNINLKSESDNRLKRSNNKTIEKMKKTTFMLFFLLVGAITANAQSGEKNFIDKPYIEVTGKAEMEIVPDEIYMAIVINEKDNKRKISLAQAEKDMVAKLKSLGIDTKKNLSVKDLSSNFKNYWIKSSDIMLSKEYQLLVSNATTAGRVMQSMEEIGLSNVSIERVDHSQMEQFRRDVKIKAVKNAKEKAEDLAKSIGQLAGKAIYIQEIDYGNAPVMYMKGRAAGIMVSQETMVDAAPEIEFEKIKLEYQISAKFELN